MKIYDNGTYTLTYDITQPSRKQQRLPESSFHNCLLKWEMFEVNGQEMKLSDDRPKYLTPIKANGVFDSGKPVNLWDGNDNKGVSVSDHTAVFTDNEQPT